MKAFILAAGRGERMRPLTDQLPKPLLEVGGKALIVWQLERLAAAGVATVVVNTARFGELIEDRLGDGSNWGLRILYSREGATPIGTGAGIRRALELLGPEPFLLVNGDVWSDYRHRDARLAPGDLAHLVLVDNPAHHPEGDFSLAAGRVGLAGDSRLTYSGLAWLHPTLFGFSPAADLPDLLRLAIHSGQVSGEHHRGAWVDVGTPDRLAKLDWELRHDPSRSI